MENQGLHSFGAMKIIGLSGFVKIVARYLTSLTKEKRMITWSRRIKWTGYKKRGKVCGKKSRSS